MLYGIAYHLADDTVLISEIPNKGTGTEYPTLLKRTKIPKNWDRVESKLKIWKKNPGFVQRLEEDAVHYEILR